MESALANKRALQNRKWMIRQFQGTVLQALRDDPDISRVGQTLEDQLLAGHVTPRAAAAKLFDVFRSGLKEKNEEGARGRGGQKETS